MTEKTLADEIITIVKSVSNNNPPPETVTITKTYEDNYVDIQFEDGGTLNYVPSNAKGSKNDIGVCVYLNGNIGNPFIILAGKGGDTPVGDYVTEEELNMILGSYVTINFANTNYAKVLHTHSEYITRDEIHDLDINLSTLKLVPYAENPNGLMCFERVQKTIDDLDIDLDMDTMANGYLKIEANLIEITREVD